jgi:hypothetical protein
VLTCAPDQAAALAAALADHGLRRIGEIAAPRGGGWLRVRHGETLLLEHTGAALRAAFQGGPQ